MVFLQQIGKSIFDYLDIKMQFYIGQNMPEYNEYLRIHFHFEGKKGFRENQICEPCKTKWIENMLFDIEEGIGGRNVEEYELTYDDLEELLDKTMSKVYQRKLYECFYENPEVENIIYPPQSKKKDFCLIHHLPQNHHMKDIKEIVYGRIYETYQTCIEDSMYDIFCQDCGEFGHQSESEDCLFVDSSS